MSPVKAAAAAAACQITDFSTSSKLLEISLKFWRKNYRDVKRWAGGIRLKFVRSRQPQQKHVKSQTFLNSKLLKNLLWTVNSSSNWQIITLSKVVVLKQTLRLSFSNGQLLNVFWTTLHLTNCLHLLFKSSWINPAFEAELVKSPFSQCLLNYYCCDFSACILPTALSSSSSPPQDKICPIPR